MVNPDGIFSIIIAFFTFLIVVFIFYKGVLLEREWWLIALCFSGITIAITFIYNFILGQLICSNNVIETLKESSISIIFPLVAILIASIDKCRIPIASILHPIYKDTNEQPTEITGGKRNKIKGGDCCETQIALTDIEHQHQSIKGAAYGFYIFFGMLYAIKYGTSLLSC